MEKLKLVPLISFRNVQTEKENSVKKKKEKPIITKLCNYDILLHDQRRVLNL